MNNIKSLVCTMANQMTKDGYNRSDAFKVAWAMVKNNETYKATNSPVQEETEAENTLAVELLETTTDNTVTVELLEKIIEYKELQRTIEELEAKIKGVKEIITNEMDAQGTEELRVDIFKIKYMTVVSNRFDTKEFKNTHKELYNEYLKESTCKRFTINA